VRHGRTRGGGRALARGGAEGGPRARRGDLQDPRQGIAGTAVPRLMPTTAARLPAPGATVGAELGPRRLGLRRWLGPGYRLGFLFVLPVVLLVLLLVAYPFCYAVYLSMTRKYVGVPPVFVGLENFVKLTFDGFFQRAVVNSFVFTGGSVLVKLVLGMAMA